jgi:hypothetical protein
LVEEILASAKPRKGMINFIDEGLSYNIPNIFLLLNKLCISFAAPFIVDIAFVGFVVILCIAANISVSVQFNPILYGIPLLKSISTGEVGDNACLISLK